LSEEKKSVTVKISKKVEDALHIDHFAYGVLVASDGLKFISSEEQLNKKTWNKEK